jgi:hypothetical protein
LHPCAALQLGKNKKDVASDVECYMKEHGVTGEEATVKISTMVDQAWRRINRACMELGRMVDQPEAQYNSCWT